jgi:hypothetical protein
MICPGMWLKLKKLPKSLNFTKREENVFSNQNNKNNSKNKEYRNKQNIEISNKSIK